MVVRWTWTPWRRRLVAPADKAASKRAELVAPRLASRAREATADLVKLTSPNHFGERYHRALNG